MKKNFKGIVFKHWVYQRSNQPRFHIGQQIIINEGGGGAQRGERNFSTDLFLNTKSRVLGK